MSDLGLLGAMRRDPDIAELSPQPGLDRLGTLVDEVGSAGLLVRLTVEGEPVPLPPAMDRRRTGSCRRA